MGKKDIDKRFTYHPPEGNDWEKYQEIRQAARDFAQLINELCPAGREKSLAIIKLEESVMWANAGIAREKK